MKLYILECVLNVLMATLISVGANRLFHLDFDQSMGVAFLVIGIDCWLVRKKCIS